jgi:hypothetical protein
MKRWTDVRSGRDVWLLTATTVEDWPDVPPWESECFGLLIATDRVLDARQLAQRTLAQGLAVVAAFGPECSQIEHVFDEAIVGDGSTVETVDSVIMTTSHDDESLDEVLEFFLDTLFPAADHAERCKAWVVFAVGNVASAVERVLESRDATPSALPLRDA